MADAGLALTSDVCALFCIGCVGNTAGGGCRKDRTGRDAMIRNGIRVGVEVLPFQTLQGSNFVCKRGFVVA